MKIFRLVFLFIAAASLRADRDTMRPIPRAISSPDGSFFLLVVPVTEKRDSWIWTAYAMGETGNFKEIWSSAGTYSREMFLAGDGRHVTCVESWPVGHSPKSDVVIAVFEEGRLVKSYRPTDLVRDPSKIQHSVSHYNWLAEKPPLYAYRGILHIATIGGDRYELALLTGDLAPKY